MDFIVLEETWSRGLGQQTFTNVNKTKRDHLLWIFSSIPHCLFPDFSIRQRVVKQSGAGPLGHKQRGFTADKSFKKNEIARKSLGRSEPKRTQVFVRVFG
ncbi:predicted protein [Coccidioides posadasii str. Silveira]|uniref:Predicted protein n=1 Tax=Coccidioides posadasii (strain RMSCC 757 / Silveira) TaxID=443226 RepID=E9CS88_COCPS|nr:predicted protein [Coccidioides posadasii str. Silveira]